MSKSVFGNTFERIVVINLDRRADRMSSVRTQLAKLGMAYTRHPATDGRAPEVAREWRGYTMTPQVGPDPDRPVNGWRDFYLGDKPRASRIAFFEQDRACRAIATAGAWGLFKSMRRVIEKAVADKVGSLLILEDDVRFHRDTLDLWPRVASELPRDWQVFQLGAMQLHWEDSWIKWHSQHLYRCMGSSFAAHAIALKRDAMMAALERSKQMDLPIDIGALTEVKRLFRDKCFTAYPNIVIQDPQDSEIGMSQVMDREAKKTQNMYRWHWPDYEPEALRPYNIGWDDKADKTSKSAEKITGFLQPYGAPHGSVERVVIVFGPSSDQEAANFISMLHGQKQAGEIAPIVVLDDMAYIPALRAAELAFEYVPGPQQYAKTLRADRDPNITIERRLSIIRRKWLPRRIMALGDAAQDRMAMWRASPFEKFDPGADLSADTGLEVAVPSAQVE